ncbi:reverse transcriptase domain-containing protein [Artemisia annua]|uniref:Reverse transcriptase domain-containing protein n=1 Tax=Artemisia annua TaxID=35608 RepID=A0A2U1M798_ARTAN|nr:reverse transcriptase domain-containing protein [Artemisia annua]
MAGDNPITSVHVLEDGPDGPEPAVNLTGSDDPLTSIHNQSQPEPEPDLSDPMMHFVVQNFNQINAMYSAFTTKRKEITSQQISDDPNNEPAIHERWHSDSEEEARESDKGGGEGSNPNNRPPKRNRRITAGEGQKEMEENISNDRQARRTVKPKPGSDTTFYNEPFTFKETEQSVRDLVASPFSKRIRDYEMPDGLKVPTNLKTYDGLSDPDDHLTVFMGTMDVHKLPEPAWCRFFHITLCGAARFWYDNLAPGSIDGFYQLRSKFRANFLQQRRFQKTQAEILGIRQRPEESLKDYLARFG